jgi:hypothetical protein
VKDKKRTETHTEIGVHVLFPFFDVPLFYTTHAYIEVLYTGSASHHTANSSQLHAHYRASDVVNVS